MKAVKSGFIEKSRQFSEDLRRYRIIFVKNFQHFTIR